MFHHQSLNHISLSMSLPCHVFSMALFVFMFLPALMLHLLWLSLLCPSTSAILSVSLSLSFMSMHSIPSLLCPSFPFHPLPIPPFLDSHGGGLLERGSGNNFLQILLGLPGEWGGRGGFLGAFWKKSRINFAAERARTLNSRIFPGEHVCCKMSTPHPIEGVPGENPEKCFQYPSSNNPPV